MKYLLIIGLAALLGGCGSIADPREWFSGSDPTREPADLVDVVNQVKPDKVWSVDIGAGTTEYARLKPAIAGGIIYVADVDREVQALDALSGKRIWKVETDLPAAAGRAQTAGNMERDGVKSWRTQPGVHRKLGYRPGELRCVSQISQGQVSNKEFTRRKSF